MCTADPTIEPPLMVINTVLSVMAYDYPQHKLSVYLSDDGGSDLTFFALLEASKFAKHWIPYCKKLNVEPRSPAAYFRSLTPDQEDANLAKDLAIIKACFSHFKMYLKVLYWYFLATSSLFSVSETIQGHGGPH